ncbi:hypothetical protein MMC13_002837 [Lambiella insularis]|nr:hypothetical protein [Lambiella insularis]
MSAAPSETTLAERQGRENWQDVPPHLRNAALAPESLGRPERGKEDAKKQTEVTWDGDDDPMNPRSMTTARKWLIVIVSSSSLCVTCTSSLYTSTYSQLTVEFACSEIVATLGLSLFVVGLERQEVFRKRTRPMVLGPLSEFYVAQNIQTMLIVRFLDGVAGSAFLRGRWRHCWRLIRKRLLASTNDDLHSKSFVCLGPEIGPIIGGFINQYTSWRWSFYVLIIWTAAMLALVIFLVPETYHPVLLRNKARNYEKKPEIKVGRRQSRSWIVR